MNNHQIKQFTATGEFIRAIGSEGQGNGHFRSPTDVAITSNEGFYVTDASRIQQFDADGIFIRSWQITNLLGKLGSPRAVAIASDNTVYVTDGKSNQVVHYTAQGDFIRAWGENGFHEGRFLNPEGLILLQMEVYTLLAGLSLLLIAKQIFSNLVLKEILFNLLM